MRSPLPPPSGTYDLPLLMPMVEIGLVSIKLMYSVALTYFDFVAGDLYEVLH
jgi:hypothetical protein